MWGSRSKISRSDKKLVLIRRILAGSEIAKVLPSVTKRSRICHHVETLMTGNVGKMIISLSLNITMNQLGGASVIAIFTTRRSHGYVNTTTWLGISQFFLFLAPNFNILTTENRSRCN